MNVDWLLAYSILGLDMSVCLARETLLCMLLTITPIQLRTLVKKRVFEHGWYSKDDEWGFWCPTKEVADRQRAPYLMLPEFLEVGLFFTGNKKNDLPIGSQNGEGFIFSSTEMRISRQHVSLPYNTSTSEDVTHYVFYQRLWHFLTERLSEYIPKARQKMNSPKRQRIVDEDKWTSILDHFEALWKAYQEVKGISRALTGEVLDEHFRKHVNDMKFLEPVDSVLLRSRLWRWWEKAHERKALIQPIPTFYNLLSPIRQKKLFKIFLVLGERSTLDIHMADHIQYMLQLLQPDDNMAIFYRYFYSPNLSYLSRQMLTEKGIFKRLPVTPLKEFSTPWDMTETGRVGEYNRRVAEENKKFEGYPAHESRIYVYQFRAFREWICCYLMIGLECDTPILEAFTVNFYS